MPITMGIAKAHNLSKNQSLDPMVLEIDTTLSAGLSYTISLGGAATPNILVDWGDGVQEKIVSTGTKDHTYANSGIYTIKLYGSAEQIGWGANILTTSSQINTNLKKLKRVISWGSITGLTSVSGLCGRASSLTQVPNDIPITTTDLSYLFWSCTAFNSSNVVTWHTQKVINMSYMFDAAITFNQAIGSWDISKVTNMTSMFNGATSFNQNLGAFNLKANVNLSSMLVNSGLSVENYSYTLIGWANTTKLSSGPVLRTLGATPLNYSDSYFIVSPNPNALTTPSAARAYLTTPVASGGAGWTIADGGAV